MVREWCVLYILILKCPSPYSGMLFFHIPSSKSGLNPQFFRYSGVQFFDIATSKNGPRMVCLYILTLKCASRFSGVQFFISPLNSYIRTRRFTQPTFRPSRPANHWKNTAFRDFPIISRVCIFCLLTFAQLYLLSSDSTSPLLFIFWLYCSALLFQLSILSEVRLLNFLWKSFDISKPTTIPHPTLFRNQPHQFISPGNQPHNIITPHITAHRITDTMEMHPATTKITRANCWRIGHKKAWLGQHTGFLPLRIFSG